MPERLNGKPQVLVLTAPVDPTADAVIQHLQAAEVPFVRFDAAQFPMEIGLTATVGVDGWQARLGGISLDELRSVYYRRPRRFAFDPAIPADQLNWCEGQARYGFWGVLEALPVTWINEPSAVQRAESKPRQLQAACKVGLSVPRTLVTSEPDEVATFGTEVDGAIITKALYSRTPRDADGYPTGVLYTAEVSPGRYTDPGIAATAHLFQVKMESACDVRVTVVGDDLYAAAIHPKPGHEPALDWRKNYKSIRYEPREVPAEIASRVRRLMNELGLTFGAIDFAVDQTEGWWFYEINPNGQWLWVEKETGLPISAALARLLEGNP